MKIKMFLVMAIVLPLISCSSDDDNNNTEENTIVGKWNYQAFEGEESLNDCEKKSTAEFQANGTYSYEFYDNDMGNTDCLSKGVKNGTWERTENGNYEGKYDYPQNGSTIVDVTMEVNSNTLKIIYPYEYAGESFVDVWVYERAE